MSFWDNVKKFAQPYEDEDYDDYDDEELDEFEEPVQEAAKQGICQDILLEINIGNEDS